MSETKEWAVDLVITSVHSYNVVARTVEEAVEVAEGLFDDGDSGEVLDSYVESADAVTVDDSADEELVEEEFES